MLAPQPFFRPRGTPFSVLHRIRALLRLGHGVDLVTYPFGESPDLDGVTYHRTARPPLVRDVGIGPSFQKLALDLPFFLTARRLFRNGRYDLLHTHEEAGTMGAWLARGGGTPHLYDMHSSLPQQFANFGRYNVGPVTAAFAAMERFTLNGASGVIAICPELRDHVLAAGYRGPLELIENTLDFDPPADDPALLESLRVRLGLEGRTVVLYTGTLEKYQGLDLLIDALPRLGAGAAGVRVVLVGGTAEQIERLRGRAAAAGVEGMVVFVPAVPPRDVFHYLRLADLLVTTRSRGTNTPLKVYQYLRAGKPIVATDIRSHTQVFDRTSAELVAPDPAAIAEGLCRVLGDPDHARGLAQGAARLAAEQYSERAYMERLRRLLERVAPRAARRTVA
jgi:glycosyltransferase involved in cell wall biosynthesis